MAACRRICTIASHYRPHLPSTKLRARPDRPSAASSHVGGESSAERSRPVVIIGTGAFGLCVLQRARHFLSRLGSSCYSPQHVRLIGVDADARHLELTDAGLRLHVGVAQHSTRPNAPEAKVTHGLLPRIVGDQLRRAIRDAQVAIVCVGLGGLAGSALAPAVLAACATERLPTAAYAVWPFEVEKAKHEQAGSAWERMRELADVAVLFSNDRLTATRGLPEDQALSMASTLVSLRAAAAARALQNAPEDRWERVRRLTRSVLLDGNDIMPGGATMETTSRGWFNQL